MVLWYVKTFCEKVWEKCCFADVVARGENYPLRKSMVYHDQNRIIAVGGGKVRDKIHGYLLEGAGALRRDRGEWGMGWMGVDFVGLTRGTARDKSADECGHARPPVVLLEQGKGAEVSAVGTSKGFVDIFDQGVAGGLGDVETTLIVEGALVEIPVLGGGTW